MGVNKKKYGYFENLGLYLMWLSDLYRPIYCCCCCKNTLSCWT